MECFLDFVDFHRLLSITAKNVFLSQYPLFPFEKENFSYQLVVNLIEMVTVKAKLKLLVENLDGSLREVNL